MVFAGRSFPNGIFRSKVDKKTYVADQLETDCYDYSGLVYNLPFEKVRLLLLHVRFVLTTV